MNEQFLTEFKDVCYNLKIGGEGNFGMTDDHRKIISDLWKGKPKPQSQRDKMGLDGEDNPMFGKTGDQHHRFGTTHTDDTKSKMSEKAKLRCENEEWMNSMIADRTGRTVIHNDTEERSVKSEELDSLLADGWILGRLPSFSEYNSQQRKLKNMERRCVDFGVETEAELKSLFEYLYHTQNLNLTEIANMYNLTVMQIKGLRDKLGISKKTREQWQSTRSDKK